MFIRMTATWLALAFLLASSVSVQASIKEDWPGSVTTGTSGTGRASVEAVESPALNPASLGFLRGYFFGSSLINGQITENQRQEGFSVALVDALEATVVPTSLMYLQQTVRQGDVTLNRFRDFRLAVGGRWLKSFSAGLSVQHRMDELAPATPIQEGRTYAQTYAGLGVLWAPNSKHGVALVIDRAAGFNVDTPEPYRLDTQTGIGYNYNFEKFFRVKLDAISAPGNRMNLAVYGLGFESYLTQFLVYRGGYAYDSGNTGQRWSTGLAFTGPRFSLSYGYTESRAPVLQTRHSVDLSVPIW